MATGEIEHCIKSYFNRISGRFNNGLCLLASVLQGKAIYLPETCRYVLFPALQGFF
jgi:hypothetical protein